MERRKIVQPVDAITSMQGTAHYKTWISLFSRFPPFLFSWRSLSIIILPVGWGGWLFDTLVKKPLFSWATAAPASHERKLVHADVLKQRVSTVVAGVFSCFYPSSLSLLTVLSAPFSRLFFSHSLILILIRLFLCLFKHELCVLSVTACLQNINLGTNLLCC